MALDLTSDEIKVVEVYDIDLSVIDKTLYLTNYGGINISLPTVNGNSYTTIPIKRSRIGLHTDLKIDTVDIEFGIQSFTIKGKSIIQAIDYGWFDGAEVTITQVNPDDTSNQREIFKGNVNKGIKYDRKTVKLSVTSILDLLKKEVPRIIYQEQ